MKSLSPAFPFSPSQTLLPIVTVENHAFQDHPAPFLRHLQLQQRQPPRIVTPPSDPSPSMGARCSKSSLSCSYADFENEGKTDPNVLPDLTDYRLELLKSATRGFSSNNIVSEQERAKNVVYKGKFQNGRWIASMRFHIDCLRDYRNTVYEGKLDNGRRIAVKRFKRDDWPDPRQFLVKEESRSLGSLRSERLTNLIGCCCEGDGRLLVAEFMPHQTLAKHLFNSHWESQPMKWAMRLRVALYLAQGLEYCASNERALYYDLNAYRILFDEVILLWTNEEQQRWRMHPPFRVSMLLSTGEVASDLIRDKNFMALVDSDLGDHIPQDDRAELVRLVSCCLQVEPCERPDAKSLITALMALQKKTEVPSNVLMGIPPETASGLPTRQLPSPPFPVACLRMDLSATHEILAKVGYKDDKGIANKLSSRMRTSQKQDTLTSKKHGDTAFRAKDFPIALEWYKEFIDGGGATVSPTVYARRCLSYLMCNMQQDALPDAKQAQALSPEWSTTSYLQAACLFSVGMENDAQETLKHATNLEAEWNKNQSVKFSCFLFS